MANDSYEDELKDEKNPRPLDEDDIALLKTYVCLFLSLKPYIPNFCSISIQLWIFCWEFFWFC